MMKDKPFPYLRLRFEGRRLVLRPYKFSDFSELKRSNAERLPSVDKFDTEIPVAAEHSHEKHKERLDRHRRHGRDGHHFIFGIFLNKSEEFVGQIDIFMINRQLRWGNLGYHIQNQHYGKGYASEASQLALKIAFEKLGFHRIESAMELDNRGSEKVARKIGMEFEGKRLKFFPDNGGIDMKVFAMNAIDFCQTKSKVEVVRRKRKRESL